jgi:hypothetical protein
VGTLHEVTETLVLETGTLVAVVEVGTQSVTFNSRVLQTAGVFIHISPNVHSRDV